MSGRAATVNVIPGDYALSVGRSEMPCPPGWIWVALTDVARLESGHTPSRERPNYWDGDIPWIGIKDARAHHGGTINETLQTVTQDGIANSAARVLPRDTVCLSRTASVGYVVVMGREMATSQDFVNWVCGPTLSPAYLQKLLIAENRSLFRFGKGSTHTTIYYPEVKAFHICLPPLNEQRRIVAKLEALQARSHRAREALDAVPPLLEKLRQSILAAAFRGDLTKDWRAKNKNVEPASKLLERIRAERRKKWEEAELAKMKAKGKPPTDEKWKSKYKEPSSVDTTGLPKLPNGWCWASVEEVTSAVRTPCYGVVQPGEDSADGVPLVRVCDLTGDGETVALDELRRIPASIAAEYDRSRLEGGELLVSVVGTIGRTAIAHPALRGANIARAIARLVVNQPIPVFWVMSWLNGAFMWHRLNLESREVARKTLNISQLVEMPVPLAPPDEMMDACAAVHAGRERVTVLERLANDALKNGSYLERAILAKAFRGELVPQDPADPPAFQSQVEPATSHEIAPDVRHPRKRKAS